MLPVYKRGKAANIQTATHAGEEHWIGNFYFSNDWKFSDLRQLTYEISQEYFQF